MAASSYVKGFSPADGNKFLKKVWRTPVFSGILSLAASVGDWQPACLKREEGAIAPGGNMSARFGAGTLSVVLVAAVFGLVCRVSAQVQTPSTGKAVVSSPGPSSDGNKPVAGGASSTEAASANAKTAMPAPDPPGSSSVHQDSKTPTTPKAKIDESYVVGVADVLLISVWKEPDFSGPVVVRPDGVITVPVVGDVHVSGLTTTQVQELLTEKLKGVVTEPQVTVIVRDIKSRKVYLMGKVGHVGAIPLLGHETVLQLLAESGGLAQFAKTKKIYILRMEGDHQKRINFPYKKVLAGSEPDVELVVGDVIVVP
jgi:polysaccharide biosynthesis/export protein